MSALLNIPHFIGNLSKIKYRELLFTWRNFEVHRKKLGICVQAQIEFINFMNYFWIKMESK